MKKVILAFVCVMMFCSASFGASSSELKRMSTFISNFTEQGMYEFGEDIDNSQLVHFGIRHNYINNYNSRIKNCPVKNCPYGSAIIDKKFVVESVKKYFARTLKNESTDDEHFDGKAYHFDHADGEAVYYADVQEVSRRGGIITMTGELYNAEDKNDRPGTFTAKAKPYTWKGKDTWSIISLVCEWYDY